MAQTGLDESYSGGASVFDLPKLTPRAADERARIWMPDPTLIAMQYAHAIGGKQAQQPGQPEPKFGGNWLCTGRPEVLKDTTPHSDVEACYMCREHKNGNPMVSKAKRKWITQVFRYATDPSGTQPLVPFTMALVVWVFSDRQYRALTEIQTQWGDIRGRDLLLTSDRQEFAFKQWSVAPLPELLLARDPAWTAYMQEAWASQSVAPTELERIIGRPPSNDQEIAQAIADCQPMQMAAPQGYAPPPMGQPGYPQQPMAAPPMPQPPMVQPPVAAPPMVAPPMPQAAPPMAAPAMPQPGYAPQPGQLVPSNGPFDQPQQVPGYAPQPGMVPPPMPPTPAPAQMAATPLPQVPDAPPVPQMAPQQPQVAPPPMAAPPVPQAPPMAAPPMAAPQGYAPPPVAAPGVVAVPGQPAAPGATVDLQAMMAAPPPPAPPA